LVEAFVNVVAVSGVTGNLGTRIAAALVRRGASVRGLVRQNTKPEHIASLKVLGVTPYAVDFNQPRQMTSALEGVSCVVSALSGTRDVVVDAQTALLNAAVEAGVPRFIPSDFSIDFRLLPLEANRNLGWRKEFMERVDKANIKATSIFNGAFMELLEGQAPFIMYRFHKVLVFGNPNQKMDFTFASDVAAYCAEVALDPNTPRALHISGGRVSARDLALIGTQTLGAEYKLFRPGSAELLGRIIKVLRLFNPARTQIYPVWQGMQYMQNMFSGVCGLQPLDNQRYSNVQFTTIAELLKRRAEKDL
jgi:nucleoside-diphosphate-sugar epimerase